MISLQLRPTQIFNGDLIDDDIDSKKYFNFKAKKILKLKALFYWQKTRQKIIV